MLNEEVKVLKVKVHIVLHLARYNSFVIFGSVFKKCKRPMETINSCAFESTTETSFNALIYRSS